MPGAVSGAVAERGGADDIPGDDAGCANGWTIVGPFELGVGAPVKELEKGKEGWPPCAGGADCRPNGDVWNGLEFCG